MEVVVVVVVVVVEVEVDSASVLVDVDVLPVEGVEVVVELLEEVEGRKEPISK